MANFCFKCGTKLNDNSKFCPICGNAVKNNSNKTTKTEKASSYGAPMYKDQNNNQNNRQSEYDWLIPKGRKVTPNVTLCDDGIYRWVYEMSLFKNPTIFLLVWKIFFFVFVGIFGFIMLLDVFEGNMDGESILNNLKIMGIAMLVMTAVVGLGMLIYAAMMGGKYVVIFEMDERGVNHKQEPSRAKKAHKLGMATALTGAASGNITTMAAGINSTRTEMYSEFSKTKKIKAYPRRDLIKVNGLLNHNQVYAAKEDFGFVYNYIAQRVPSTAVK